MMMKLEISGHNSWIPVSDGDDRARAIFKRHYSYRQYRDGRRPLLFVGPGEKIVLLTRACDALFVWRKFIDGSGQTGVNCAVFRNEGTQQSSSLVTDAMAWAWSRWPSERLYTYVNPKKIQSSNPGYCFIMAGWKHCGETKGGLVILEAAHAIHGSQAVKEKVISMSAHEGGER